MLRLVNADTVGVSGYFHKEGVMGGVLVLLAVGIMTVPADIPAGPESPGVPEVAPPPRETPPAVAVVPVKGGYRVSLNRRTAERLSAALDRTDEKEIAAQLRGLAKDKKDATPPDEDAAATLEMIAFVVSGQLPGFKAALAEKTGPHGVVITLTGLQAPVVTFKKPRPRLERALEAVRGVVPLMPADARAAVEALRAVGRTTPLFWTVEPR